MPNSGTQCILCDLPIRFDTYEGCTHNCRYCFVQRKRDIAIVKNGESAERLIRFIKGQRTKDTNWCDWDIPLHFGGLSDPFQPVEKERKRTLAALKVFAETKYPVVISTKGKLCIEEPWLSLLRECNVVMQVSMACSSYDKLETGAPTYEQRLHMVEVLSKNVKRVNVRVQPYLHECFDEIKSNIKRVHDAGAYAMIFEGMKFIKKKPGLVNVAGDWCYKYETLQRDFSILKDECHRNGLVFLSGENRLRSMGDSLTCCGTDGMEGFKPNYFNANHLLNGDRPEFTEGQAKPGTCQCFKAHYQDTVGSQALKGRTFKDEIVYECGLKYTKEIFHK